MVPAYKRFCSGQPVILNPVLGLQIYLKLALRQRRLHSVRDGLLPQEPAPQLIVIGSTVFSVLPLDAVGRQQGPVAHLLHGNPPVVYGINPPFHHNIFRMGEGIDLHSQLNEHVVRIFCGMLQQAGKLIRVKTAADPLISHKPGIHVGHAAQEPVPCRYAENIIDKLEILYIGAQDVILPVRMLQQNFLHALIKKLFAVQPGQPVILDHIDHSRRFP